MEAPAQGRRSLKTLVLVPARGGSKGLPGKNLREVGGISLTGRAVRVGIAFLSSSAVDGMVLVDTDSEAIAEEGRRWGAQVPFLRPSALGAHTTPMIENVLAALDSAGRFDVVVLLQPTSPLRSVRDVALCWAAFDPRRAPSVIGVTPSSHPPEQTLRLGADGIASWAWPESSSDSRRQDLPTGFRPTGSVFINSVDHLRKEKRFLAPGITRGVVLPVESSVDIDSADDLAMAESMVRARAAEPLMIGRRAIGPGEPCFVIAEAGVNAGGSVDLAHQLVDVAADAGADAVKFQTFNPDLLVAKDAPMAAYQVSNTGRSGSQAEMLRGLVLPHEAYASLQQHAHRRGLLFLSTPFDEASADLLEELGVPAFKMASGELTNHPFLRHVAMKGRPMLLSTGMANIYEIGEALDVIQASGHPQIGLFHCVTNYPASPSDANLNAMASMLAAFSKPVGWSDHTEGVEIALAAVALGASIVEKHFTLDRSLPGPDHKASLDPRELMAMVHGIRAIESSLGDGAKRPRPSELPLIVSARKSLHLTRDLPAGHLMERSDLVALRPGDGIPPSRLGTVLGKALGAPRKSGDKLREEDLG